MKLGEPKGPKSYVVIIDARGKRRKKDAPEKKKHETQHITVPGMSPSQVAKKLVECLTGSGSTAH